MDQVKWGMIGCGNVTEIKSGPAIYKSNNSSLIAVMCPHIDRARNYAARHNITDFYDTAEQIINHPYITAVYIATPVKFHAPYAIQAMEAGKAVYLEKPMALNYKQCLELKEVSIKTGSKLFVAYYRRSLDYFIKIKELINAHAIGEITSVAISLLKPARMEDYDKENLPWRVIPELSGGGYFYDLACHQIDLLQFLLGPIVKAKGYAENKAGLYQAEDTVSAEWTFASGISGAGNWSFVCRDEEKQDTIILYGTKGRIEFSTFDFTPIQLQADDNMRMFNYKTPAHIQMPFIETIIHELTGRGTSDADLDSAVNTNKVMNQIILS
jgi:1,5-anhydro-D-fructose reductase (1,5-anhydro-D-mannitol-forming)